MAWVLKLDTIPVAHDLDGLSRLIVSVNEAINNGFPYGSDWKQGKLGALTIRLVVKSEGAREVVQNGSDYATGERYQRTAHLNSIELSANVFDPSASWYSDVVHTMRWVKPPQRRRLSKCNKSCNCDS
ncbi:hypothetical protein ACVWWO_006442 [Bradyrhizobium sp. F1.13.1]